MKFIPTGSLRSSDVPSHEAAWGKISQFALSFNGYEWAGALECGDLANSTRQQYERSPERQLPTLTLDELRACLFFEQRRFHHFGEEPQLTDLVYIRALVQGISEGLSKGAVG